MWSVPYVDNDRCSDNDNSIMGHREASVDNHSF
jgi:hypothetical protein